MGNGFDPDEYLEARREINRARDIELAELETQQALATERRLRSVEQSVDPDRPVDILLIPDSHFKPGQRFDRARWAGEFAVERRPDIIIAGGDWWDFAHLFDVLHSNAASGCSEAAYLDDLHAGLEARRQFWKPFHRLKYRPQMIFLVGNHEYRVQKWVLANPNMAGMVSINNLEVDNESLGNWTHVPFLKRVTIGGITFQHYFTQPGSRYAMGRGSISLARNLVLKGHTSACCFHSHRWSYHEEMCWTGQKVMGLEAGCYFEHDEAYAGEHDNQQWWRGLTYLRGVQAGYGTVERHTIEELRANYG